MPTDGDIPPALSNVDLPVALRPNRDESDNNAWQVNNAVDGDLVGRDKIVFNLPRAESKRRELVAQIRKELETNGEIKGIVSKLEHFNKAIEGEVVVGLEAKLTDGKQDDLIPYAKHAKEAFAKKLNAHLLSETAQTILARLLAEVYSRFHRHISPQLKAGIKAAELADLIQTKIIDPLKQEVDVEVLDFYADELDGTLYFLTGNCHIKWT